MINNIKKSTFGLSFNAKLGKMRKEQNFVTYPIQNSQMAIQSESRFAIIDLTNGQTKMSKNKGSANSATLVCDIVNNQAEIFFIPKEYLEQIV